MKAVKHFYNKEENNMSKENQQQKIEVIPFVPRKGYDNPALNTDFYEFNAGLSYPFRGTNGITSIFCC